VNVLSEWLTLPFVNHGPTMDGPPPRAQTTRPLFTSTALYGLPFPVRPKPLALLSATAVIFCPLSVRDGS
jgi:hypothetical protein